MVPTLSKIARNGQISESRAENLTNLREFSMRVFLNSEKCGRMIIWSKQIQKCCFSWKKTTLRSRMPHIKFVKNEKLDIIQLNLIKVNGI